MAAVDIVEEFDEEEEDGLILVQWLCLELIQQRYTKNMMVL